MGSMLSDWDVVDEDEVKVDVDFVSEFNHRKMFPAKIKNTILSLHNYVTSFDFKWMCHETFTKKFFSYKVKYNDYEAFDFMLPLDYEDLGLYGPFPLSTSSRNVATVFIQEQNWFPTGFWEIKIEHIDKIDELTEPKSTVIKRLIIHYGEPDFNGIFNDQELRQKIMGNDALDWKVSIFAMNAISDLDDYKLVYEIKKDDSLVNNDDFDELPYLMDNHSQFDVSSFDEPWIFSTGLQNNKMYWALDDNVTGTKYYKYNDFESGEDRFEYQNINVAVRFMISGEGNKEDITQRKEKILNWLKSFKVELTHNSRLPMKWFEYASTF